MKTFRFRARYKGVAITSMSVGGSLAVVSASLGFLALPLVTGALGIALGAAYLASPMWRIAVTIDDEGLEVGTAAKRRFRVAWGDVVRVIVALEKHSCFVDGGTPETSLLVPGDGAPMPYDIENRKQLVAEIVSHMAPEKIEHVASLADAPKNSVLRT